MKDEIQIEAYNDGFMVNVYGKKYRWDHNEFEFSILKTIIEDILSHNGSKDKVIYSDCY